MLYLPNAIVQDETGIVFKLAPNEPYTSYQEAKAIIEDWKKGYELTFLSSWIDVHEGDQIIGCIDHECNVDSFDCLECLIRKEEK